MSESRAEYYAKHLQRLQEQVITDEQVETIQPTGLPELLAHMVTEFQVGLGEQVGDLHETLAEHFTICLLACAQPLLTDYLTKLANPPVMMRQQTDGDTNGQPAWAKLTYRQRRDHYEWYVRGCRHQQIDALSYEAWLADGANVHPKVTVRDLSAAEREQLADERRKREIAGSFYTRNGEE